MGANVGWSYGTHREYETIARRLNRSTPAERQRFVDSVRREGGGLMEAHALAFPAAAEDRDTARWRAAFERITANWFGEEPMWYGNSVLSPGQIHEIMRESRARTVELLDAGAGPLTIYIGCGHPRFRTIITWDGATAEDAELTADGHGWSPRRPEGEIVMWVLSPFNTGYAHPPSPADAARMSPGELEAEREQRWVWEQKARAAVDDLVHHVESRLDIRWENVGGRLDAEVERLRRQLLGEVPNDQLVWISAALPIDTLPWRNTVLGAVGDGNPRPGRAGLQVTFEPQLVTPPALPEGIGPEYAWVRGVGPISERRGPGITITWSGDEIPAP
jgi:hypothetical protein